MFWTTTAIQSRYVHIFNAMRPGPVCPLFALILASCLLASASVLAGNPDESANLNDRVWQIIAAGDQLVKASERDKASERYREAASLARGKLSPAIQVEVGYRLVGIGDLNGAIDVLRETCDPRTNEQNTCLTLVKFLAWSGQPIAAAKLGEKLIENGHDDPEIRLNQAIALSWQGDGQGALDLYSGLADDSDDLNVSVGYINSLLATGRYARAVDLREQLTATNDGERELLRGFDTRLRRDYGSGLYFAAEEYEDIYNAGFESREIALLGRVLDARYSLKYSWMSSTDGFQDLDYNTFDVWGETQFGRVMLAGSVGRAIPKDNEFDPVTIGSVNLKFSLPLTWITLRAAREQVTDSPLALRNGLLRDSYEAFLSYRPADRWQLQLFGKSSSFSDHNNAQEYSAQGSYTFRLGQPRMVASLKYEEISYDEITFTGYFSPTSITAEKFILSGNYANNRFAANLELYVGSQTLEWFGATNESVVVGLNAALSFQFSRGLLNLSWEKADLGIDQSNSYRYERKNINGFVYF